MEKIIQENNRKIIIIFFVALSLSLVFFFSSCKRFVEIDSPITQITSSSVFTSEATATAAVVGIYSRMMQGSGFASGGTNSILVLSGLSSDEFKSYSNPGNQFYTNSLLPTNDNVRGFLWNEPYQYIYTANSILEGLGSSYGVSAAGKQELTGEAKFVRAFCYFYLVNLFGDVPLHLTTDYRNNNVAFRTPQSQVYQQIIADLKDAQNSLPGDYAFSDGERTRPNKWAATALLARVYLYMEDWANSETQSTSIINSSAYALVTDLDNVFSKNSSEAIWQLLPVQPGFNTNEGRYLILTSIPTIVSLSDYVANAFEAGDQRKAKWVGSFTSGSTTYFYPFKYKTKSGSDLTEYSMVFRLAEQYLIRAEARARQDNIPGARNDLNTIRTRAGLPDTNDSLQADLLRDIMQERRVELFAEWAQRWFDLKRTNSIDAILGPVKGTTWQPTDALYPIPQLEIQNDPNIVQNTGY
jgi:hypothetical protein